MGANVLDDSPIESGFLSQSLNKAQQKVEERAYEQRKNLFEYDEVLNQQRNIVYRERRIFLMRNSVQSIVLAYGEQFVTNIVNQLKAQKITLNYIHKLYETFFSYKISLNYAEEDNFDPDNYSFIELHNYFFQEFWLAYQSRLDQFAIYGNGLEIFKNLEKQIILNCINISWKEQLQKASLLREAVRWRSYGQKNPLTEYRIEAYKEFKNCEQAIIYTTVYLVFNFMIV